MYMYIIGEGRRVCVAVKEEKVGEEGEAGGGVLKCVVWEEGVGVVEDGEDR